MQADGPRHDPWLSRTDKERDERQITDYTTYEGFFANEERDGRPRPSKARSLPIASCTCACNYYPDPVAGNPRVKATFKASEKRAREPKKVKMPTTKGVVIAGMARFHNVPRHSQGDNKTVEAGVQIGWLFLLRASEFCFTDGGVHDYCLRLGDLASYDKDKKRLSFRETQRALSMSIVIRRSKPDQARVRCTRKFDRT